MLLPVLPFALFDLLPRKLRGPALEGRCLNLSFTLLYLEADKDAAKPPVRGRLALILLLDLEWEIDTSAFFFLIHKNAAREQSLVVDWLLRAGHANAQRSRHVAVAFPNTIINIII